MSHIRPEVTATIVDAGRARLRDLEHIDRCVACRRAATEYGIASAALATALDAARSRRRKGAAAGLLAAVVVAAAVSVPLRGGAAAFISVFEPQTVGALPLTTDELRSLSRMPDLARYASARELRASTSATFTDARAAAAAAGFALRVPTYVPAAIRSASFGVNGPSDELIAFTKRPSAHGATAAAPLPGDIAGSTLRIDIGAAAIASYATASSQRPNAPVPPVRALAAMPIVVVQMPVPRIASTGVSLTRLAAFMLAQPGVSPRLAAAFAALGDLSTTLPIPIPIEKAYTQPVVVDGVQGVGMGDDTGLGAAVVWQKNGMLFGVFATQPAPQVLAIANSLR